VLIVGFLASKPWLHDAEVTVAGQPLKVVAIGINVLTQAHLVLVFFRSHANRKVFSEFPIRFTVVPLVLFAVLLLSRWALLFSFTATVLWDVYHAGAQNFGLGRIYDAKRGINPTHRRSLDLLLSQVLYAGPIVAGASLMLHLNTLKSVNDVGSSLFDFIPAFAESHLGALTKATVVVGALVLGHYVATAIADARKGVVVSWQKVALLASSGFCSLMAWGFSAFGTAYVMVNLFHAVQYFAIVWWTERGTVKRSFGLEGKQGSDWLGFAILCALSLGYGAFVIWGRAYWTNSPVGTDVMMALTSVVALMHFWYDGFVWSVRKKAVPT
jgi:hypothetical protein